MSGSLRYNHAVSSALLATPATGSLQKEVSLVAVPQHLRDTRGIRFCIACALVNKVIVHFHLYVLFMLLCSPTLHTTISGTAQKVRNLYSNEHTNNYNTRRVHATRTISIHSKVNHRERSSLTTH